MANTDRLAQATDLLRECRKQVAQAPHSLAYEYTLLPKIDEFLAALASLAPAAVEGDAAAEAYSVYYMHVNNKTKPRDAMRLALTAAFPVLTAQVAALTAQCERESKLLPHKITAGVVHALYCLDNQDRLKQAMRADELLREVENSKRLYANDATFRARVQAIAQCVLGEIRAEDV